MTGNLSFSFWRQIIFALAFVSLMIGFNNHNAIAVDNPGPVEIGGKCTKTDTVYHSLTSTRTQWTISELYAVPTGTTDPKSWEQYLSFNTQLLQALQPPEDAAAFAKATGSIWQKFFSDSADIIVTLERTVTGTDHILQCQSGIWGLTSTQNTDQNDVSEWLQIGTFDVSSDLSIVELEQALQAILDDLNSQPGGINQ